MSQTYQQCLRKAQALNLRNLLAALRKINVQEVEMTYKVCGETEVVDTLTLKPRPPVSTLDGQQVKWFHAEHKHPENSNNTKLKPMTLPVIKALETFALSWVDSLYPHWRTNEGASGSVEIIVIRGECFLDHFEGQVTHEEPKQVVTA